MANELTSNLPPWVAKMRNAAQGAISEQDIAEIVKGQVERAKKGDANAIRFVFDQVLGGPIKGATFIQNNFPANPSDPTPERPGSSKKIGMMRARVAAGKPVFNGEDGPELNLD